MLRICELKRSSLEAQIMSAAAYTYAFILTSLEHAPVLQAHVASLDRVVGPRKSLQVLILLSFEIRQLISQILGRYLHFLDFLLFCIK